MASQVTAKLPVEAAWQEIHGFQVSKRFRDTGKYKLERSYVFRWMVEYVKQASRRQSNGKTMVCSKGTFVHFTTG